MAPDAMRGRVIGLYFFAFAGLIPFGSLLAGWLVDVGGTQLSLTVSGVTSLGATLWAVFRGPTRQVTARWW